MTRQSRSPLRHATGVSRSPRSSATGLSRPRGGNRAAAEAARDKAVEAAEAFKEAAHEKCVGRLNKLNRKIAENFTYTYDPTLDHGTVSADGLSDKGGWVLVKRKLPAKGSSEPPKEDPVTTPDGFRQCIAESLTGVFGDDADAAAIQALVKDRAFMGPILDKYSATGTPWRQKGSDFEQESKKVLFGGEPKKDPFFKPTPGQSQEDKTKDMLSGLVDVLKNSPGDTVTLSVPAHAERRCPSTPRSTSSRPAAPSPRTWKRNSARPRRPRPIPWTRSGPNTFSTRACVPCSRMRTT